MKQGQYVRLTAYNKPAIGTILVPSSDPNAACLVRIFHTPDFEGNPLEGWVYLNESDIFDPSELERIILEIKRP